MYTGAMTPHVETVSTFIKNRGFSGTFTGNWMLVAEWRDVPRYPAISNEQVSLTLRSMRKSMWQIIMTMKLVCMETCPQ